MSVDGEECGRLHEGDEDRSGYSFYGERSCAKKRERAFEWEKPDLVWEKVNGKWESMVVKSEVVKPVSLIGLSGAAIEKCLPVEDKCKLELKDTLEAELEEQVILLVVKLICLFIFLFFLMYFLVIFRVMTKCGKPCPIAWTMQRPSDIQKEKKS